MVHLIKLHDVGSKVNEADEVCPLSEVDAIVGHEVLQQIQRSLQSQQNDVIALLCSHLRSYDCKITEEGLSQ